jgi:hypothetical protein
MAKIYLFKQSSRRILSFYSHILGMSITIIVYKESYFRHHAASCVDTVYNYLFLYCYTAIKSDAAYFSDVHISSHLTQTSETSARSPSIAV